MTTNRRGADQQEPPNKGARLLAKYLKDNELDQLAFETKMGFGRGSVSRWLSGSRRPTLPFALILQKTCRIPPGAWSEAA